MYLHGLFPLFPILQGSFCDPPIPQLSPRPVLTLRVVCPCSALSITWTSLYFCTGNDDSESRLSCPWAFGLLLLKEGMFSSLPSFALFFHLAAALAAFGSLSTRPGHCSRRHRTPLSSAVVRTEPEQCSPAGTFSYGLVGSPCVTRPLLCRREAELTSKAWVVFFFNVCLCIQCFMIITWLPVKVNCVMARLLLCWLQWFFLESGVIQCYADQCGVSNKHCVCECLDHL